MQTSDYYWIEIVTLDHIIVNEVLTLDRNSWYYIIVYKQMIIDKKE